MVNTNMRTYDYYTLSDTTNDYGEETISTTKQGQVKLSINLLNKQMEDSVLYAGSSYVGITMENVNDKMIIEFNGSKLKILYINDLGRYKQVYMAVYGDGC